MDKELYLVIIILISIASLVLSIICGIHSFKTSYRREFKVAKLSNTDFSLSNAVKYLKITNMSDYQLKNKKSE